MSNTTPSGKRPAASKLRYGDRVKHDELGPALVMKVMRADSSIRIRVDSTGATVTCDTRSLTWLF